MGDFYSNSIMMYDYLVARYHWFAHEFDLFHKNSFWKIILFRLSSLHLMVRSASEQLN